MKKNFSIFIAALFLCCVCISLSSCENSDYSEAMEAYNYENYEMAYERFIALGDYKDSAEKAKDCQYKMALELMNSGKYEEAIKPFTDLGDYKDSADKLKECRYSDAKEKMTYGNYGDAVEVFTALGTYKDSASLAKECKYNHIEQLIIGEWYDASFDGIGFTMWYRFEEEELFYAGYRMDGTSDTLNMGTYKIDMDASTVRVKYIVGDIEEVLFPFEYKNGKLSLNLGTSNAKLEKN